MGKIRRNGYVLLTWISDHAPRHVHVYRNGGFVVKWDLENGRPMRGDAPRELIEIIADLEREGLL